MRCTHTRLATRVVLSALCIGSLCVIGLLTDGCRKGTSWEDDIAPKLLHEVTYGSDAASERARKSLLAAGERAAKPLARAIETAAEPEAKIAAILLSNIDSKTSVRLAHDALWNRYETRGGYEDLLVLDFGLKELAHFDEGFSFLSELVRGDDPPKAVHALAAILETDDSRVEGELLYALKAKDPWLVRYAVAGSYLHFSPAVEAAVLEHVSHPDEEIVIHAMSILSHKKSTRAVPVLRELIVSGRTKRIREHAAQEIQLIERD